MSYGEAVRLTRVIRADPGSMIAAAVEEWAYPLPRDTGVLMDLYDATRWSAGDKKWKGYPRPWVAEVTKVKRGDAAGRTPEQIKALLHSAHFGQPANPV